MTGILGLLTEDIIARRDGDHEASARIQEAMAELNRVTEEDRRNDLRSAFPTVGSLMDSWDTAKDAFTVERFLRPGYRCLVAAYESTGKTYVAMQMALHFVYPEQAGSLFGEFAVNEPLSVLYVDAEVGTGEALRRLKALAKELRVVLQDDHNLRLLTLDQKTISLTDDKDIAFLGEQVDLTHEDTGRKVVLFLDSADSLFGKELWGKSAEAFDTNIKTLMEGRREWLIVITLAHTVKKPREQKGTYRVDLQDVLGNITRQADSVLILDGNKSELSLRAGIYKRPGHSLGILQRDEDGFAWRWTKDLGEEAVDDGWKTPRATVLHAMSDGWTGTAYDLGVLLGVDKVTARRYLNTLCEQGVAGKQDHQEKGKQPATYYWLLEVEG